MNSKRNILKGGTLFRLFLFSILVVIACGPRTGINHVNLAQENTPMQTQMTDAELEYAITKGIGNALFKHHCAVCHVGGFGNSCTNSEMNGKLFERFPKTPTAEDYFRAFVSNSDSLRKAGEPYSLRIHSDYRSVYDHHFGDTLSMLEIRILERYIKGPGK